MYITERSTMQAKKLKVEFINTRKKNLYAANAMATDRCIRWWNRLRQLLQSARNSLMIGSTMLPVVDIVDWVVSLASTELLEQRVPALTDVWPYTAWSLITICVID